MTTAFATLYFFDVCGNNIGYWSRCWFESRAAAKDEQAALINEGYRRVTDPTGEYGEMTPIYTARVHLTKAGVLRLLNVYGNPNE